MFFIKICFIEDHQRTFFHLNILQILICSSAVVYSSACEYDPDMLLSFPSLSARTVASAFLLCPLLFFHRFLAEVFRKQIRCGIYNSIFICDKLTLSFITNDKPPLLSSRLSDLILLYQRRLPVSKVFSAVPALLVVILR